MQIRREISLGTLVVTIACVVFAFATIGLFSRMTPAVEAILKDNVESQAAAFDLLEALARRREAGLGLFEDAQLRAALSRARDNITVPGEEAIVAGLEEAAATAFRGDEAGFVALADRARQLWSVNMEAMHEANASASRLGTAGAWTGAFGGMTIIGLALCLWFLLQQRVVGPIEDLARVLDDVLDGRPHARCRTVGGARDLDLVRSRVNTLLNSGQALRQVPSEKGKAAIRAALVTALEHLGHPAAVIHRDGRVLVANEAGLKFFMHREGLILRDMLADDPECLATAGTVAIDAEMGARPGGPTALQVRPVDGFDAAVCVAVRPETAQVDRVPPGPTAQEEATAARDEREGEG
jgi:hypothetical protein